MVTKYSSEKYGLDVGDDFLIYAITAMRNLQLAGRENVIYGLSKGLSVMKEDSTDTIFPRHRMPMGLLEFMSGFFIAKESQNVSMLVE